MAVWKKNSFCVFRSPMRIRFIILLLSWTKQIHEKSSENTKSRTVFLRLSLAGRDRKTYFNNIKQRPNQLVETRSVWWLLSLPSGRIQRNDTLNINQYTYNPCLWLTLSCSFDLCRRVHWQRCFRWTVSSLLSAKGWRRFFRFFLWT
jgi:hypothetical protein